MAQDTSEGPLPGEVTAEQPQAEFPLQLEAGDIVTLTTSSDEGFDTVLTLTGPNAVMAAAETDLLFFPGSNGELQFLDATPVLPAINLDFDLQLASTSAVFRGARAAQ